jgi:hypothetical protein
MNGKGGIEIDREGLGHAISDNSTPLFAAVP